MLPVLGPCQGPSPLAARPSTTQLQRAGLVGWRRGGGSSSTACRALQRPKPFVKKMSPLPKIVAFDLDGTLWYPEMYQLSGGYPFKRDKTGAVYDSSGEQIRLLGATRQILTELATDPKWKGTQVAYVSRTEYPEWAVPCLQAFMLTPTVSMWALGAHSEIYPGSKRAHFKEITRKSGVPYEEMIFYDNERWNITDCKPLGITCVYTPDGLTEAVWQQGLREYAAAAACAADGS